MATPRSNAAIDQNRKPTLIGVSSVDGVTPTAVEVDPATGQLLTRSGVTGRAVRIQQKTDITASTSETTVLSAVAATLLDVYGVLVANTSATACEVTFKDSTAGTTRFNFYVPAGDTRGFMVHPDGAHNQTTANNNWTATCSASVSSIKITMMATAN